MKTRTRTLTALAVLPLALAACGGGDDTSSPSASPSASASASPSASASVSASASSSPSETPSATPTPEVTQEQAAPAPVDPTPAEDVQAQQEAVPTQAQQPAGAVDPVQEYFATGGHCTADVWTSTMPYDESLLPQIRAYCDANDLGDWANGQDPMDVSQYGGGQPTEAPAEDSEFSRAYCESLDPNTATSGEVQGCYLEYGVRV